MQENQPDFELEALECVELDTTYIQHFGLDRLYDSIYQEDIRNWENWTIKSGDLAILGDVIEHIPKSVGLDLVDFITYNFKHLIVITPIDMVQGAWQGRQQERHVSRWFPTTFFNYPNHSSIVVNGMMYSVFNGVCCDDKDYLSLDYIADAQVALVSFPKRTSFSVQIRN